MRPLLALCALTLATSAVTPANADPEADVMACFGAVGGSALSAVGDSMEYPATISCVLFGYATRLQPVRFSDGFTVLVTATQLAPTVTTRLITADFHDGATTYSLTVNDLSTSDVMPAASLYDNVSADGITYYIKEGVFGPTFAQAEDGPIVNFHFVAESVRDVPIS